METKPNPNTLLSAESQTIIRKMLDSLDALCCNNRLWNYDELEKAMEQMLQGDFSTPSFSRHRHKLAYLLIHRQILHLLSLEAQISEMKKEKELVGTRHAVSESKDEKEKMKKESEPNLENRKKQTGEMTEPQPETSAANANHTCKTSPVFQRKKRRGVTTYHPNKSPPQKKMRGKVAH